MIVRSVQEYHTPIMTLYSPIFVQKTLHSDSGIFKKHSIPDTAVFLPIKTIESGLTATLIVDQALRGWI